VLALNNILICIDHLEPDQRLFNFLSNFNPLFKEQNTNLTYKIFFNEKDNNSVFKVPNEVHQELEKLIYSSINAPFSLSIEISSSLEGQVLDILKFVSQNNIDLIIFYFSEKNHDAAIKITRSSACSVLLLSPELPVKLDNILVPIDFSAYSKKALEMAFAFAEERKLRIFVNHIYYVPEGYHSEGKSYDEMAGLVYKNAKKEYQDLIKEYNSLAYHIIPSFILDDDKDPTDKIFKEALDQEVDLIIMFSKGKTASGSEIMGNTAKTLLLFNTTIPLLILKNKKENADIADYIWKTASIN
jgi:nucleotide-binding universal stress UspA family protein